MPDSWEKRWSSTHSKDYYYNKQTGKSQWELPVAGETVQVCHLLVKHAGSRRPSSWRQEVVTRSEASARDEINGYRQQIVQSADPLAALKELAGRLSDCSSAKKGGDLGVFARGQMQPAFEDAS